jgi:hypothetical protein
VELCVLDASNQAQSGPFFQSLVSAAAGCGSLKALEVGYTPRSAAEREFIWSVAASHPTLSALRVRYRNTIVATGQSYSDLFDAMEAAARSNRQLAQIELADANHKFHQTKEYKDRILPILWSNRVAALTDQIKRCTDDDGPAWGGRLLAVAVHRLCQSNNNKSNQRAAATSLSCLLRLLRGNPEWLERCTRVPEVLHRLWDSHMGAVDSRLGKVLQLERRMAAAGVEAPSTAALPNVTSWMGKDDGETPGSKRSAVASGDGDTPRRPKRPRTN